MSVTLVYIPRKYKRWESIPGDIIKNVFKFSQNRLNRLESLYEYEETTIPVVDRDLKNAWSYLINRGVLTEQDFGVYEESEDVYNCPIFSGVLQMSIRLSILVDSVDTGDERCSCIVNLSSNIHLPKLKVCMLEEILK